MAFCVSATDRFKCVMTLREVVAKRKNLKRGVGSADRGEQQITLLVIQEVHVNRLRWD